MGRKKVCETFWMRKSEQSMLLHENQHRFGRIVFFSIVFALVKSMLLFHLGDLLLTFSSSLATKHTTQCHTFVLRITFSLCVCACAFYAMQKFHVRNCKSDHSSPFLSPSFCAPFSLTHSIQMCVVHNEINRKKKPLKHWLHAEAAAAHSNYNCTRLVK